MNKKIIFFGCSMRGGQSVVSREDLAKIPGIIKKLGYELVSKHQTEEGIIEKENSLSVKEIHDRDYNWLLCSDAGIFEISNPSLGVGGEISDMLHEGKPVLCLFKGDEAPISAYIRGKEGSGFIKSLFNCQRYETLKEAEGIIKNFLRK